MRDISALIERIQGNSSIVLVGEQALNFWSEALGIMPEVANASCDPISTEIEFLGSAISALEFGRAACGTIKLVVVEEELSWSTALVTVNVDDHQHCIDFLRGMQGFSDEELERVRRSAMPIRLDRGQQTPLLVMHPVHCLREQLETVYGYPLSLRREPGGEHFIARVNLAIEACRRITLRHLKEGDIQSALKVVEAIHAISLLPAALRARVQDAVCVDYGIVESEAFPKEFRERRLRQFRHDRKRKIYRYWRTYAPVAPNYPDTSTRLPILTSSQNR